MAFSGDGFSTNATHRLRGVADGDRAALDVAEAGLRQRRLDSEEDDPSGGCQLRGIRGDGGETRFILDQVIGRKDNQRFIRAALSFDQHTGGSDRRRGVSPDRFEQQLQLGRAPRSPSAANLFERLERVLGVRDDDAGVRADPRSPQRGPLQQRGPCANLHERLGHGFARHRPEPGTRTAAQNDCQHRLLLRQGGPHGRSCSDGRPDTILRL